MVFEPESATDAESFVFVDGPRPTEADHIFDHFFLDFPSNGYDATLVKHVQNRRNQTSLEGVLFYDDLLSLAVSDVRRHDEARFYPPSPGKEGLVSLIERISSSSFDRIRRTALLYYLVLDLDAYNSTQHATAFVKATGLPRSMRHAMTGYWHLDNGNYRIAVSYLEQPDFVSRIARVLSPLTSAVSPRESEERAYAFASFMRLVGDASADTADGDGGELQEAKVVAACWTQGIRVAWLQCRSLVTEDGGEEEEAAMARCVARIVEYCFMPTAKPVAVQALLALPLTPPEETLLSHVIVNPTPNVHLSPSAHATAIDALLVRYINSGQYVEAVLLDRRVDSSLRLLHLSGDAKGDGDGEKLRKLRAKRQGLIKATLSVLTRVERLVLELGDDDESPAAAGTLDDPVIEEEASTSDASWERVPVAAEVSVRANAGPSYKAFANRPLSASPAIRSPQPTDKGSDPLLSAVARSSPARKWVGGLGNRSAGGGSGSPLSRAFAASPSAKRTISLRKSIESLRSSGTPTQTRHLQEVGDTSIASPLARGRPYQLESLAAPTTSQYDQQSTVDRSTISFGGLAEFADNSSTVDAPPLDDTDESGPMARLARQLENELQRDSGVVEGILRRSLSTTANVSPFRVPSSTQDRHAQATLTSKATLARPTRRYEARYELGQEPPSSKRSDHAYDGDTAMEQMGLEGTDEVPARRRRGGARQTPMSAMARSRARKGVAVAELEDDGDTSVPGSFPGQLEASTPAKQTEEDTAMTPARRRTMTSRKTRQSSQVAHVDDEGVDDVPDLVQTTSTMRKSRSAASGLGRPKASTPLRRSTRLSVEPDAMDGGPTTTPTPVTAANTRQRSARSASPSKKPATTPTAAGGRRRTRRGASQAPTDASDDDGGGGESGEPASGGVMTRSSSRRKGGGIPGAF